MLENLIVDYWFWFALGILLLIIEIFTFSTYALWMGIGAFLTGFIAFLFPSLDWPAQGFIFALMAVVGIIIGYKFFRSQEVQKRKVHDSLNRRGTQYIGRTFKVVEAIEDGRGVIKVNDTIWIAKCDTDAPIGTKVKVHNVEGNVLVVKIAE